MQNAQQNNCNQYIAYESKYFNWLLPHIVLIVYLLTLLTSVYSTDTTDKAQITSIMKTE